MAAHSPLEWAIRVTVRIAIAQISAVLAGGGVLAESVRGMTTVEPGVIGPALLVADPVIDVTHAVIVGARIVRGRVVAIDTAAARESPGVLAVLTHRDGPQLPIMQRAFALLQDDIIQHADQPIAIVVADTLEHARAAATLVATRYELPPPLAIGTAALRLEDALPVQPWLRRGDIEVGLRNAQVRIDAAYTIPMEAYDPLEPHATIASWHGDDRLTLYDTTRGIPGVRERIAGLFGLPAAHVRVINQFVGDGFGCKGTPWSHVTLTVLAAKHVGRPVKLVMDHATGARRPHTIQTLTIAADAFGRLTAVEQDAVSETARCDEPVPPPPPPTRMLYACPNVSASHRVSPIDVPTPTLSRVPVEIAGSFAVESAMDELAYALNLDPLVLRQRNHPAPDVREGGPASNTTLLECYRRGSERFGWEWRKPRARSMCEHGALIGWGVAAATYPVTRSRSPGLPPPLPGALHAFGVNFAEIRVDEELGEIRLTRFVGAFACGPIRDLRSARSQLFEGIVWSVGMAFHEHTGRERGRIHADVPLIEVITIDEADPSLSALGTPGLEGLANTGAAAAIANAVFHATGIRIRELPITLDKVVARTG